MNRGNPPRRTSLKESRIKQTTIQEIRYKKLLVPIDFSECSYRALDYATALAKQFDAQIGLMHVVEPRNVYQRLDASGADRWLIDSARMRLTKLAQEKIEELIPVNADVRVGGVYDEICEAAQLQGSDLIVIGTHGRTGLKRVFLGSTAERVVRYAPCSVLVVRGTGQKCVTKFCPEKILVPVDFSACSKRAVQEAILLAKQYRASLLLVHVVETYCALGDYGLLDYGTLELQSRESAKKELETLITEISAQDIPVKACMCDGHPASKIVEITTKSGVDLIVISTHGRTGLNHVLLGSTAEEVVRQAPCPVVTLRGRRKRKHFPHQKFQSKSSPTLAKI